MKAQTMPRARRASLVLWLVVAGHACGRDTATQPPVTPVPTTPGAFTISVAPATVLQGASAESRIDIVRSGGFTGSVALAVGGAPAGVTATITPNSTTGTTATLVVTTASSVAPGSVSLTVTATAAALAEQTALVPLAVMPNTPSAGNVALDFSTCPSAERPIWFAAQDGTGAWKQVAGAGDVYRFDVTSTKGGYALVSQGSQREVYVTLATRAELTSRPSGECRGRGTKTASGTLAGMSGADVAYVGLGGGFTDVEAGPASSSFVLSGVHDGLQDLLAYRTNPLAPGVNDRVILRRDQNIANGGSVGAVDFSAAESFAPATATLTVTGAGSVSHFMAYLTGAGCSYAGLYDHPNGTGSMTMRGIPADRQRPTDFHFATAYVAQPQYRAVSESFHSLSNRVIALPAALPFPTIIAPAGGHKRLQASLLLPAEYQRSLTLLYFEQQGARGWVTASFGWLGSSAAVLTFPDLSGTTGWRSTFLPAANASVGWFMSADGASSPSDLNACVENARFVSAYLSGTE